MIWVKTTDGRFINLAHVCVLEVGESGEAYQVVAHFTDGDHTVVTKGNKDACEGFIADLVGPERVRHLVFEGPL